MAWSIFREGGGDQVAVSWAKQLLQNLGAPVTPGNIQFIYQWEKSEGGGGKYNPLNQGPIQGHPNLTTSGSQFGGGAADFASWQAGLQGATISLHYSNYKGVLQGLMSNDPTAARLALWQSPWAASHYGYTAAKGKASNWFYGAIPNGTSVLPPGGFSGSAPNSGSGATADQTVANTNQSGDTSTCAWNLSAPTISNPGFKLGPVPLLPGFSVGGQQFCLVSKVFARQMIGAGLIFFGGVALLAASMTIIVSVGGKKVAGPLGKFAVSTAFPEAAPALGLRASHEYHSGIVEQRNARIMANREAAIARTDARREMGQARLQAHRSALSEGRQIRKERRNAPRAKIISGTSRPTTPAKSTPSAPAIGSSTPPKPNPRKASSSPAAF